jgi:hypothetical protein
MLSASDTFRAVLSKTYFRLSTYENSSDHVSNVTSYRLIRRNKSAVIKRSDAISLHPHGSTVLLR